MDSLKGKVAVVTGSTSGIGLGVARAMARQGAAVLLNGFGPPAEIERLRQSLSDEHGVKVAYSAADLSKPAQIAELVAQAASELGGVDILVNNAGIQHVAPVETFPAERWDAILAVNLSSNFHAISATLPLMLARGWGRIINIASAHGLVASKYKAAYVAAKHGVVGLTKVVALETARTRITCNAICPGWVLTPLVERQVEELARRDGVSLEVAGERLLAEKTPSQHFATPDQIGELALFLCSEAASEIRGSAISIDGGWTAQ